MTHHRCSGIIKTDLIWRIHYFTKAINPLTVTFQTMFIKLDVVFHLSDSSKATQYDPS